MAGGLSSSSQFSGAEGATGSGRGKAAGSHPYVLVLRNLASGCLAGLDKPRDLEQRELRVSAIYSPLL